MRVVMKPLEKTQQLFVDHGVTHDRSVERFQSLFGRQVAAYEQISHFERARFLRKLLHRIATIQKNARIAVDIGDLAFGACGGHKSWVECKNIQIPGEVRDIE